MSSSPPSLFPKSSPQVLAAYDVEMPAGLVPICADGEVEEFVLLPIREVRARARVRVRVKVRVRVTVRVRVWVWVEEFVLLLP